MLGLFPRIAHSPQENFDEPLVRRMINPEIEKAINGQINQELSASYIYLGMSAYFEEENLTGFANWCLVQHQEEQSHAMRLLRYLQDREGRVQLDAIPAPKSDYSSPLEVFQFAQKQEKANTQAIDELYERASGLNDHATISHLQWFVDEQVEEEKSVAEVVALVERAGSDVSAILYLNDKLGDRSAQGDGE